MVEVNETAKSALKIIFSDFLTSYNSNNIKEKLGISQVGSLKLLRSLKEKNLLVSEKMGKAIFYKPNLGNDYLLKLLELAYSDYSNLSPFVRGWLHDLRLFDNVQAVFLFGSILTKGKNARDIDVCFILNEAKDYSRINQKIGEMNQKNRLKIHPLFLTEEDFRKKLSEKDAPLVGMAKTCIVVQGQELFVEVLKDVQSKK